MLAKVFRLPPVRFVIEVGDTYARVGGARSAAALSYFLILTLFPLLMCVHYFIGLFHLDLEQALVALEQLLPGSVLSVMADYLNYVSGIQSSALLVAGLGTITVSASAGLRTLLSVMDALYDVRHVPVLRRFFLSILLSILFLATIYLSVVVIFTGDWFFGVLNSWLPNQITALIPLAPLSALWRWLRYLLLFCFVFLLVLTIYRVGTPRGTPRRFLLASSLCTALAMVACSVLFSWFIGMSSRYALVYGSLASMIILLVWLYFCGNILLLGAVVSRVGVLHFKGG